MSDIVTHLTLEEKASLCSGSDFWHTKSIDRLGIPSFMLTDGPHGLRKQNEGADHLGINQSVPATCFPTACATACSFDRDLLREIGAAMGKECRQEEVTVILGPGLNIKRSPLCGRNFEYFSEDPLLSGEMAAAMIKGIQDQNVAACPKHFALNNQETNRMVVDSVVDERAKREIYYRGFEIAVRKAAPQMIMCSYNKIDDIYACENNDLLSTSLRETWGFDGAIVTDWGAMDDRVESLKAGLDLQMPSDGGYNDARIVEAVREGRLDESVLDSVVERMILLAELSQENAKEEIHYDPTEHHAIARNAAAQSCVLLKNDSSVLPIKTDARIAVIGQFAKTPRYQGAGSSIINPTRMESALDALSEQNISFDYAEGYSLEPMSGPDPVRIEEACKIAQDSDIVLLFAGLPDEYESEGFDRKNLDMPKAHDELIEAVRAINPNTVVILQSGAPVLMPWQDKVPAILLAYLGGQAGGGGVVDVLFGKVNPCGHLSETWPGALRDTPSYRYFPGNPKTVEYRESIFVGYRYFDTAGHRVAWPFGHGLSYTSFEYSDLNVSSDSFTPGEALSVSFTLTNTGTRAGADVAQLYVGVTDSVLPRAAKELKGFEKVYLEPGESKIVTIELDQNSFSYFNTSTKSWAIEAGEYLISLGRSSADIVCEVSVKVSGDQLEGQLINLKQDAPEYYAIGHGVVDGDGLSISDHSFEALLGRPLPPTHRLPGEALSVNSPLRDAEDTFIGKRLIATIKKQMATMLEGNDSVKEMAAAMFMEMPIRALGLFSNGAIHAGQVEGLVDMMNGKMIKGLKKFLKK